MTMKRAIVCVLGFLFIVGIRNISANDSDEEYGYLGVTHGQPFDPDDDLFKVGYKESEKTTFILYVWEDAKISCKTKKRLIKKIFRYWCSPRLWLEWFLNIKDELKDLEKENEEII